MKRVFTVVFLFATGLAAADGRANILAWPGKPLPRPPQRDITGIVALPTHDRACPVCGFVIAVPEPEKLMRGAGGEEPPPEWEMDMAEQDADLCPHPDRKKLAYQADILVCPSCGLAAKTGDFFSLTDPGLRAWALERLRPNIRAAQRQLLGKRGDQMTGEECAAFFNRQEELPDRLRTEQARATYAALRAPRLVQAEMNWRSAWAARRELTLPPGEKALAATAKNLREKLERQTAPPGGVEELIAALVLLQGKNRAGRERLAGAELCASLMLLAGLYARHGDREAADETLVRLRAVAGERYARAEQDPLWPATPSRASGPEREKALEDLRDGLEREAGMRRLLLAGEGDLLSRAAGLLKDALAAGEFDGDPERAVFYSYLIGEFLRRSGALPLAAEWFKAVQGLTAGADPLHARSASQLEAVSIQAGDRANLLSAIGRDGELFEKLRAICNNAAKIADSQPRGE
jgi:hypothetical protein